MKAAPGRSVARRKFLSTNTAGIGIDRTKSRSTGTPKPASARAMNVPWLPTIVSPVSRDSAATARDDSCARLSPPARANAGSAQLSASSRSYSGVGSYPESHSRKEKSVSTGIPSKDAAGDTVCTARKYGLDTTDAGPSDASRGANSSAAAEPDAVNGRVDWSGQSGGNTGIACRTSTIRIGQSKQSQIGSRT